MEPIIEFHSDYKGVKPMFACGNCRMLSTVYNRNDSKQAAIDCCKCEDCGVEPREGGWTRCVACRKKHSELQNIQEQERLESLPEIDYDNESPVFWLQADKYFIDLASCEDYIFDEDTAEEAIVHPCSVDKLVIPDLVDYIEERWYDELEDAEMSKQDAEELRALQARIKTPTVWYPIQNVRLKRTWLDNRPD